MEINGTQLDQNQALQSRPPQPENNLKTLTMSTMVNLWERLVHLYGHKWSATYGVSAIEKNKLTDVAQTWSSGLRGITGEQIAQGLHACCSRKDTWPPTLPEFRTLCLKPRANEFGLDYVPEVYREQPQRDRARLLSSDERDAKRKKYQEEIAAMREKYGI